MTFLTELEKVIDDGRRGARQKDQIILMNPTDVEVLRQKLSGLSRFVGDYSQYLRIAEFHGFQVFPSDAVERSKVVIVDKILERTLYE